MSRDASATDTGPENHPLVLATTTAPPDQGRQDEDASSSTVSLLSSDDVVLVDQAVAVAEKQNDTTTKNENSIPDHHMVSFDKEDKDKNDPELFVVEKEVGTTQEEPFLSEQEQQEDPCHPEPWSLVDDKEDTGLLSIREETVEDHHQQHNTIDSPIGIVTQHDNRTDSMAVPPEHHPLHQQSFSSSSSSSCVLDQEPCSSLLMNRLLERCGWTRRVVPTQWSSWLFRSGGSSSFSWKHALVKSLRAYCRSCVVSRCPGRLRRLAVLVATSLGAGGLLVLVLLWYRCRRQRQPQQSQSPPPPGCGRDASWSWSDAWCRRRPPPILHRLDHQSSSSTITPNNNNNTIKNNQTKIIPPNNKPTTTKSCRMPQHSSRAGMMLLPAVGVEDIHHEFLQFFVVLVVRHGWHVDLSSFPLARISNASNNSSAMLHLWETMLWLRESHLPPLQRQRQ